MKARQENLTPQLAGARLPLGISALLSLLVACSSPGQKPAGDNTTTAGDGSTNTGGTGDTSTTDGTTSTSSTGVLDEDGDGIPDEGVAPGGIKLKGAPEYHAIVRLTHAQWENSIADIF